MSCLKIQEAKIILKFIRKFPKKNSLKTPVRVDIRSVRHKRIKIQP